MEQAVLDEDENLNDRGILKEELWKELRDGMKAFYARFRNGYRV